MALHVKCGSHAKHEDVEKQSKTVCSGAKLKETGLQEGYRNDSYQQLVRWVEKKLECVDLLLFLDS
jgi:hypothetical protein